MHICMFPGQLRLGGVGRVAINLMRSFTERGIDVDLFLTRQGGEYFQEIPNGVRRFVGGGSVMKSVLPLIRYMREHEPDVLWSAREYINVAALLARRAAGVDTRVVATIHTNETIDSRHSGSLRTSLSKRMASALYPRADSLVTVSADAARDMLSRYRVDPSRVRVIYNPIYSDHLVQAAKTDPGHPWLDTSIPLIISVGRLTKQKDYLTLLRAFSKVVTHMPSRLMILGEGEDRHMLESEIERLRISNSVALLGYVPNPEAFVARASVFVMSSAWEGFGNVLVESFAVGTPVVATDCRSGPAEILDEGRYGPLVPVGDAESMAQAIMRVIEDPLPADQLVARAMEFSVDKAADSYVALFESLGA